MAKSEAFLGLPGQPDLGEDISRLYVARIEHGEQEPYEFVFQTLEGEMLFRLYGEIVLEAETFNGKPYVAAVRRLALYGSPEERREGDADPYGVISIVGASPPADPSDEIAESQTFEFLVTLHYRTLSREPADRIEDAEFPRFELMLAKVALSGAEVADGAVEFSVEISASLISKDGPRLIQSFFESIKFTRRFLQGGTGEPRGKPEHSLSSHCDPPEQPFAVSCFPTLARWLPVRFVNFTSTPIDVLEPHCQALIDHVCTLWRNQAALDLTVVGEIEEASDEDKAFYAFPDLDAEAALHTCIYASAEYTQIYICEKLDNNYNGGFTYVSGQASAYCLIDLGVLMNKQLHFLLAHEIGHVLGLGHPGAGSPASIMSGADHPDRHKITASSCRILEMRTKLVEIDGVMHQIAAAFNPIVRTTTVADCFRPLG